MDATLEELVVRIKTDQSALDRGLNQATQKTTVAGTRMAAAFGSLTRAAGLFGVTLGATGIIGFGRNVFIAADEIKNLSMQTDFAISSLVALDVLLAKNGGSLNQLSAASNILSANIGAAAEGSEELLQKFDALGLSVEELKRIGPEQAFYAVTRSLFDLNDASRQADLGRDLLGRGFRELIPTLKDVNGELSGYVAEAEAINGPELTAAINAIDDFGDSFDALAKNIRNGALITLGEALQTFQKIADTIQVLGLVMDSLRGKNAPLSPDDIVFNDVMISDVELPKSPGKGNNKAVRARRDSADAFSKQQKKVREELNETSKAFEQAGAKGSVFATIVKDHIGDAFESALFDAKNFGDAMSRILSGIARQIAHAGFIDPLSGALGTGISNAFNGTSSSGWGGVTQSNLLTRLIDGLPSFDVGSPFVPRDMVAKIHKGERIVPAGQNATQGPSLVQHFHFASGVTRAELAALLPAVRKAAAADAFAQMQQGGGASRLIGNRA